MRRIYRVLVLVVLISSGSSCKRYEFEEPVDSRAVDLGLSVLWANCNVGADVPEDFGCYYAWGETEGKILYSWINYKYNFAEIPSFISGTEYDAAHVNWGDGWRMPTAADFGELDYNCSKEPTSINGVNGMLITGPNGNSIFLPAAGYYYMERVHDQDLYGCYWFGQMSAKDKMNAYFLSFGNKSWNGWSEGYRFNGRPIRPVKDK